MRSILVSLKGELCKISQDMDQTSVDSYGKSEIAYLLHLIDGFLLGYFEPSDENLSDFMESVISVAVVQLRFDLLKYVKPFSKMLK